MCSSSSIEMKIIQSVKFFLQIAIYKDKKKDIIYKRIKLKTASGVSRTDRKKRIHLLQ